MTTALEMEAAARLTKAVRDELGDPSTWVYVRIYPKSLALGTIDAIWSVRVRSAQVVQVVARYAAYRRAQGANPEIDTPSDLLGTFEKLGVDGWISQIGNRQRTYASPQAPEKADAVRRAAQILADAGLATPTDLGEMAAHSPDRLSQVEAAWKSIPGETTGLTWHRLALVTGAYDLAPSPWLLQFIGSAVGDVTDLAAERLLDAAASRLGVSPMAVRQAVWNRQVASNPTSGLNQ
ncbi:MAG: hypothetical protein LBJ08_07695 [Bifidobacteriaceae bacterium]|jgi:hypothetical protein|nr:hypothetical protein [Bifidobacteriaceae bacterium]